MAFSVNTNVGAMAALQSLNETSKNMATTQSRINTGLNVNSTKDDSAAYTIAQTLRGDVGGLKAVTSSLNRAKSTVDVAVAGAEQISDLLNQMKSKATEASDEGLDTGSRDQIKQDLTSLKETVDSVIKSSSFNGSNLLSATGASQVKALTSAKDLTATLDVANQNFEAIATPLDTSTVTDAATAATFKGLVDTAADAVKKSLSTLGSASRKIDGQLAFNSKLSDVIEGGIGNLVDADLAKESARLQALQVKQQLGVQALSIANQAPQAIMSLFR
ncbi:flagellin [uncultured Sphingomonas sp.]|uniref:flagellin n=1 Tax=uncultured Sphingomonas sp. TaxID=158754 RepID=UPI00262BC0D2|nr:flagellin [uncultured Sphingomonas sp.]